jgi:predicted permease
MATPGYYSALGIPLVAGRFFSESDNPEAPQRVIINRTMAQQYWPGENVIGKRMSFHDEPKSDKDWITVVGVVGDVKDQPNSPGTQNAFWFPVAQQAWTSDMSVVIRARSDPRLLTDALRNEVHRRDPELAIADVQLMDQIVDTSVSTPRFAFALVGLFAVLAIVLAGIGTYGVISYSVSQRTPELGIRMALGAVRSNVLGLVLAHAARLAAVGTVLGVLGALVLARLLKSLVFGVSTTDPVTFAAVAGMVVVVALLAGYIPALRATMTDPVNALRAE